MCEYEKWCEISYLKSVVFCVKIGKNSARNQSKTLILQSKNQIFQKFLSSFAKTSYERRATRNGYIFASKVQVALIIEALLFCLLAKSGQISKSKIRRLLAESAVFWRTKSLSGYEPTTTNNHLSVSNIRPLLAE